MFVALFAFIKYLQNQQTQLAMPKLSSEWNVINRNPAIYLSFNSKSCHYDVSILRKRMHTQ